MVDPAAVGTIGRPAHGIFLTSGGDALPGVGTGSVITLAPLESGLSEELLTFVTARQHPAHSGPRRDPLPHRFLPQAQAGRPGHRLGRVSGTAHAGRPHAVPPGQLRRRPQGAAALGMALRVREPGHGAAAVAPPGRPRLPGRPHGGPHPRSGGPALGRGPRTGRIRYAAAGAPRGWQPRRSSAAWTPWPSPRKCCRALRNTPDVVVDTCGRHRRLPRGRGGPGGFHLHQGHGTAATGSTLAS